MLRQSRHSLILLILNKSCWVKFAGLADKSSDDLPFNYRYAPKEYALFVVENEHGWDRCVYISGSFCLWPGSDSG